MAMSMERVSITRLKNSLSAYLAEVKAGTTLVVTDREIGVASITPVSWDLKDDPMKDLVLSGQVTPHTEELPEDFLKGPRVKDPAGSLRAFLTEERD
ncbi:type II toxin-antitoxin system Phd/YefM family antitoxin [Paludisphaera mucosa]|uniref:Antitoxin n=1 Tax=Paludisphaera mucosa TaxID=3030827 RepID=A0ABT6FLK5_9BACT|nr:hypothetical protein [Paludisphaera mucosa]MDG3008452.1 hypothetical protein [Paludisphaera mucosa]